MKRMRSILSAWGSVVLCLFFVLDAGSSFGADKHGQEAIRLVEPRTFGVPIKGIPFSAKLNIEYTPVSASQSPTPQTHRRAMFYRNSDGNIRVEVFAPTPGQNDAAPALISITDPGKKVGHLLDVRNHIDYRVPLQIIPFVGTGCCPEKMMALESSELFILAAAGVKMPLLRAGWRGDGLSVDPTAQINGFDVEGYGDKLTLPEGKNGSDKEIVVTIKAWYAPVMKAVMLIEVSDSRSGTTRIALADVKRTEPETALFQVHPGYRTIDEQAGFSLKLADR